MLVICFKGNDLDDLLNIFDKYKEISKHKDIFKNNKYKVRPIGYMIANLVSYIFFPQFKYELATGEEEKIREIIDKIKMNVSKKILKSIYVDTDKIINFEKDDIFIFEEDTCKMDKSNIVVF
ncbi:MAG: hypothetical protein AABY32_04080 [Nanoarchaeota archaeon]